MEQRKRIRLDREAHTMSSGHGKGTLILGLIAAAAGLLPLLRATEVVTAGKVNAPLWVLGCIGGLFVAIGLFAGVLGWVGMRRQARATRLRQRHPDQPEIWDHTWKREAAAGGCVVGDHGLRRAMQGIVGAGFFGVFLVPFAWWAWLSGEGPLMVQIITSLFILLFALSAGTVLVRIVRVLRFGEGRLHLPDLPLRGGETYTAELRIPGDLGQLEQVHCTLRFVEESWEVRHQGSDQSRQLVRDALWQTGFDLEAPGGVERDVGRIEIPLELPGEPGLLTSIAGTPVRYWELAVQAVRPGLDYAGSFVLPVYAASADTPAQPEPAQPEPVSVT